MVFRLLAFTGKGSFYVIETAEELLERRLAERGTPDLHSCWQSFLFECIMTKCSHPQAALRGPKLMLQRMNVPSGCGLFCKGVIHAMEWKICRGGHTSHVLDQMLSSESLVEPNCICVNSCIDTWAKSGQVQRAQHFAETDGRIESAARKRAFAS